MADEYCADVIDSEEVTASIHNMMETLTTLCHENGEAFRLDDGESGQRLSAAFFAITDHIATLIPLVDQVRDVSPKYDFDADTPFNGYRSFISIVETFVIHAVKLTREVGTSKNNIFFRKSVYMKYVGKSIII